MRGRDRYSGPYVLGLALAATTACSVESTAAQPAAIEAASTRQARGEARQAVVTLFDALAEHDCEAIAPLLGGALRARMGTKPCADFLASEPLASVEVRQIGEAQVDGRDPRSFFVTVSIVEAGRERPVMVRTAQGSDGHRVVSM